MSIANAESRKWCVYQFEVRASEQATSRIQRSIPFYVGIGRKEVSGRRGRASDRLRWVCSQIKRELKGEAPQWHLHTRVMRFFILTPQPIKTRFIHIDLSRKEALREEKKRIRHLLERGHILANIQHNPNPPHDEKEVIRHIQRSLKAKI